jgi:hypothetical protein
MLSQDLARSHAFDEVNAPVLVIRGADDDMMSRVDSQVRAEIVNQVHTGDVPYLELRAWATASL